MFVDQTVTRTRRHAQRKRRLLELMRWNNEMLIQGYAAVEYERFYVRHEINLVDMPNEELRVHFRLETYGDFVRLREALQLPPVIVTSNGIVASADLALAVVLKRLAFPNRWVDCMKLLGREQTQLSRIFNETLSFLYRKHGHLLECLDQPWLTGDRVASLADAVERACGYYDNCWGFIDGTARPICRPKKDQRHQYSGHCRRHVMKFQSIVTPDGLIANLFGPTAGRRNDNFLLAESNLRERLRSLNGKWGREMCLYGDKGYSLSEEVQVPYKGRNISPEQQEFNLVMSRVRISVEYGFLFISRNFAFGNYEKNQKLYWQQVGKSYLVSAILTNCLNCMYGVPLIKRIFGIDPPSLEFYLGSLDAVWPG